MLALCLRAKSLNPKVKVYARATISEHTPTFENAGADFVFSPEVDCAVKLSSIAINKVFQTQSVPFANGQLLFHTGGVKIKNVKKSNVLAVYKSKKSKTEYFGKKSKNKEDTVLEFVTFRKHNEILKRIDKFLTR